MQRRAVGIGIGIVTWLLCAPARAQGPGNKCNDTPPAHALDWNGNLLPEFRDFDPGACPSATKGSPPAGTVSAHALAHKPTKAARKEFDRGIQAQRDGQIDKALRHFADAVRLDPNFVEARIELAAAYAGVGEPAKALDYANGAVALEPSSAAAHSAKASVLVILNRPGEAEPEARRALQLDPGSVAAHYMLGMTMVMQGKITAEAAAHLSVAAGKYPRAHAFLAQVQAELAGTGK